MSKYSIDSSTLMAIGDAIRNKTGRYISGFDEPILEPFVDITIDTTIMEPTKTNSSYVYYDVPINLSNYMDYPYLYFTYEYETNQRYYMYHAQCSLYWPDKSMTTECVAMDYRELTKTSNGFTTPLEQNPIARVMINASAYEKGAVVVFKLKLWFCDSNKKFYKLNTYTPLEMADEINRFVNVPNEAFNISNNCQYRFAYGGSDWLINLYGDKITTTNITNASYMFSNTTVKEIPFELNLADNANFNEIFYYAQQLEKPPKININTLIAHKDFGGMFQHCNKLKEIPDWVGDLLEKDYNITATNTVFAPWGDMFASCYSLRSIPEKVMKYMANPKLNNYYYGVVYSKPFSNCYCLDEFINIYCDNYNFTSNQFNGFFANLSHVKDITFKTNEDGTPVVVPWKSQTLDLTTNIGYNTTLANFTAYNSGITADKEVKDDTTYQLLKNDPDWFSLDVNYSRYNRNSAIETINSLPDCSATGTNIIKFKGSAGSLTDGGAINTLTEEEIAVASAKGWTVSFT